MPLAAADGDAEAAGRSERRVTAALASAPDAMIGVNGHGEIELVNGRAEWLFGWASADLIGRGFEVLVPSVVHDPSLWSRPGPTADPQIGLVGARVKVSALRRDGSEFPAEISLSAQDGDQQDLFVLVVVRDVSEGIELEAERQRRSRVAALDQKHQLESLGQLASGAAHDFNNLLGVVLNYTALVESAVDDRLVEADLGKIRAAVERGAALTRQLLTFARRDVVHAEPLEVTVLIRGLGPMLVRTIGEDIGLRLQVGDPPLIAVADRGQLEQIVVNLALNARDAMPKGGVLTIMLEGSASDIRDLDDVVLRIADTGTGMTPAVIARAFEPFFTTKERGRGSGLGLATVYGIVRRCGGDVSLTSDLGSGTTVTVRLPGSKLTPKSSAAAPNVGGTECVLLVEDEVQLRVGTARLLRGFGYEVVVAGDSVEAMEMSKGTATSSTS